MKMTGTYLRWQRQKLGLSQANLAELSCISQHILSAFELGKADLPKSLQETMAKALADKKRVTRLAERAKRYREHRYVEVPKLAERAGRIVCTTGNIEYRRCLEEMAALSKQRKDRKLTALSLFSGCGGFSLGFSSGGFLIKGYLELEDAFRRIYQLNFPDSLELGGDITRIGDSTLAKFRENIGVIDVIIGGPPCQGFSLSGKRRIDDPRNTLFKHYLRFVDAFRPRVAVLENVRLLTSMKNPEGQFVKDVICQEFEKHGYKIKCFEVNAKDYGVPQHRDRVIFIAIRNDINEMPSLPQKTHAPAGYLFSSALPYRTFADACSDLEFIESGERSSDEMHQAVRHPAHVIDWLWDVPEGRSAHENEDPNKRPPSGYNTTYKRQVWTEPASTVQTTFGMISGCRNVHPIATRSLTIREAARIQSFPDSYNFLGSLGEIRTGIGNAVPPLLAYQIARHIKKLLNFVKVSSF